MKKKPIKKIKDFLREIFAPKVNIYYGGADKLTQQQMNRIWELHSKAFTEMNKAFEEMNKLVNSLNQ